MAVTKRAIASTFLAAALLPAGVASAADPIEDFYKGKTLRVIIGYGPGGGYDLYGRLFADNIGKFLPGNPTVIAQNMAGAGSFVAAKYLYSVAPHDGTTFGSLAQTLPLDTAMKGKSSDLDATRMPYIGRLVASYELGAGIPGSSFKGWEDARKRQLIVGATGSTSPAYLLPAALNKFGGTKFKIISGYKGSTDILLAVERKEVDIIGSMGVPLMMAKHPDWLLKKAAPIVYQGANKRHPLVQHVPALPEMGTTPDGKIALRAIGASAEIGRSVIGTPNFPKDRLAAVRKAFMAMVQDTTFLAEAKKRNIMIEPLDGAEVDTVAQETLATPKPILDEIAALLKPKK
jgi:tripartite-type tricarboxylate transporter receptor subunit TctC